MRKSSQCKLTLHMTVGSASAQLNLLHVAAQVLLHSVGAVCEQLIGKKAVALVPLQGAQDVVAGWGLGFRCIDLAGVRKHCRVLLTRTRPMTLCILTSLVLLVLQDNKKIKSEAPFFELLTTELVASEEPIFNVSRFLPSIRCPLFCLRTVISTLDNARMPG